jgi:hypothetical protein
VTSFVLGNLEFHVPIESEYRNMQLYHTFRYLNSSLST